MKTVLIVALLAGAAAGARAQNAPAAGHWEQSFGNQDVAASAGVFQPTARFGIVPGDRNQVFGETGYLFTLDYFHDVTPWAALGLEGAYIAREKRNIMHTYSSYSVATGQLLNTSTKVSGDSQTAMLTLRLRPRKLGWRPYLVGGIGLAHTHMQIVDLNQAGYVWVYNESQALPIAAGDSMTLAWTGRAGIEYAYIDGGQVGLEVGYWRLSPHSYPFSTDTLFAPQLANVVSSGDGVSLLLKCSIRFGGPNGTRG